MNKFTHIVDRITRRLGYVVVPAWRWAPNTLEAHLQQLFEMRSVSCVIDVGANTGQYHDFLRYIVGYKGWIASFEPVKANYRALKEKAQGDPRWRVFNCGLGAANGTAEINVMRDTQFSSLLAPDDSVVKQYKNENEVMYRETIEVRRLADVVTDITDQGIPFSQCPEDRVSPSTILIVGSMWYAPNRLGLEWFLKNCWPRIADRCPHLSLRVVGTGAERASGQLGAERPR